MLWFYTLFVTFFPSSQPTALLHNIFRQHYEYTQNRRVPSIWASREILSIFMSSEFRFRISSRSCSNACFAFRNIWFLICVMCISWSVMIWLWWDILINSVSVIRSVSVILVLMHDLTGASVAILISRMFFSQEWRQKKCRMLF